MKELYIYHQEEKIRKLLFKKKEIDTFLQNESIYSLFCSNYKKRLEGYVIKCSSLDIEGDDYLFVIFESDGKKVYVFNSKLYEERNEAVLELKKMIRYFPLFGFNSKYLFKEA